MKPSYLRRIPPRQAFWPNSEESLTTSALSFPIVSATGTAKGRSGQRAAIGPNDRFGDIRRGGFVLTPVSGETFTLGTLHVRNDYKARKHHNIPEGQDIPRAQLCRDVYDTIFEAARGVSRGPVKYDAVEVPAIEGTEMAIVGLYRYHLVIDPHDPTQVEQWELAVMTAANILGMGVEEARKLKALTALLAVGDVRDSSGKVNLERASLVLFMAERLLRERRGDITIKKWRMGQNLVSITNTLQSLVRLVETMDRVAFQAFNSDPLTGNPGMAVRQDNAARFWRKHAKDLRTVQIRPFGNWCYAMSVALDRAATAMDDGNIAGVLVAMQQLQAVATVAKARVAVERVLAPVAEMRDIGKQTKMEEGPWRSFTQNWAMGESGELLGAWVQTQATKAAPLSVSGTGPVVTEALNAANTALTNGDLQTGYTELKAAAKLLERTIRLPEA